MCVHIIFFSDQQDVLIPAKDFSNVIIGDILEIYHPEDEFRFVSTVSDKGG